MHQRSSETARPMPANEWVRTENETRAHQRAVDDPDSADCSRVCVHERDSLSGVLYGCSKRGVMNQYSYNAQQASVYTYRDERNLSHELREGRRRRIDRETGNVRDALAQFLWKDCL